MTNAGSGRDLDTVDRALLAAVQRDGRATLAELADAIQLSVSATRARLRALEQNRVIISYAARVDAAVDGHGPCRAGRISPRTRPTLPLPAAG
jgi:Lrp/AsnC family leucine-responsive transcriptional regulator